MSVFKERIYSLLSAAELKPEWIETDDDFEIIQLESGFPENTYHSLGGEKDWRSIKPFLPDIAIGETLISVDDHKSFNRYRAITLRSELYQDFKGLERTSYQRFCRNFEKECVKSGANLKDWTSRTAELHFGKASDPGDFYQNGSPLWKMNAFRSFLSDHYYLFLKKRFIRIAIYDNLMIGGKLQRLDKLLMTSNPAYETPLIKYLSRRLGLVVQN